MNTGELMFRIIFLFLIAHACLSAEIKLLYSAALIDDQFDSRKEEYIKCLDILNRYGYLPRTYIVDSCAWQPRSFFDSYTQHVLYANTNNLRLINKGVNEATAMMAALDHFAFDDEDMIIKLTGRYFLDSNKFLTTVEDHPDVDVFLKYVWTGSVFTGCYAMRCKNMKEFLRGIDLVELEKKLICIETKAMEYINKLKEEKPEKVFVLEHLDLSAPIFGYGTRDYTKW